MEGEKVSNSNLELEKLKPQDIPGALIESESEIGKWTVDKLKFWLKCRRLNQQGNKKQLVEKVVSFNAIPKYRDNVYDPDPEKSYTKAKVQRRLENDKEDKTDNSSILLSTKHPEVSFPTDEMANKVFNTNFSVLPNFVPMDAFQHVKNSGKSIKKYDNVDVVVNSNDKGLRMMRFVHDLQVFKDPQNTYVFVRACCWASYKRDRKYKIKLIVHGGSADKIKSASCDRQCPASKSECCCHVMAVIWKLEDMTRKGELKESDTRTCTSKPQQWGKGGKRDVNFFPVMSTSVVKPRHASDGAGKRKRGVHSQFFDPRPVKARKIDPDAVIKLKNNLLEVNPQIPFAVMLPEDNNIPTVNTLIGPVASGSVLHKQLQGFQMARTINSATSFEVSSHQLNMSQSTNQLLQGSEVVCEHGPIHVAEGQLVNHSGKSTDNQPRQLNENNKLVEPQCLNNISPGLPLTTFPPLPIKSSEETVDLNLFHNNPAILNKIQVSLQAAQELHAKTIGQANNNLWHEERKYRITASNFGKIMKRKSEPTPEFIKAICDPIDISNLSFVKYGRENEGKVADMYVKTMHKEGNTGLRVAEVGLCVNPSLPHLGASLDRVVFDPMSNDKFGGLEIKTNPKAGSMGLSIAELLATLLLEQTIFWF
ncbi:hypothetical protein ACROYT_G008629 [Oculina patagonica]